MCLLDCELQIDKQRNGVVHAAAVRHSSGEIQYAIYRCLLERNARTVGYKVRSGLDNYCLGDFYSFEDAARWAMNQVED